MATANASNGLAMFMADPLPCLSWQGLHDASRPTTTKGRRTPKAGGLR
jgi:hypothetical protein